VLGGPAKTPDFGKDAELSDDEKNKLTSANPSTQTTFDNLDFASLQADPDASRKLIETVAETLTKVIPAVSSLVSRGLAVFRGWLSPGSVVVTVVVETSDPEAAAALSEEIASKSTEIAAASTEAVQNIPSLGAVATGASVTATATYTETATGTVTGTLTGTATGTATATTTEPGVTNGGVLPGTGVVPAPGASMPSSVQAALALGAQRAVVNKVAESGPVLAAAPRWMSWSALGVAVTLVLFFSGLGSFRMRHSEPAE